MHQIVAVKKEDTEFLKENMMIGITGFLVKKEQEGGLNDLVKLLVQKVEEYIEFYEVSFEDATSLDRYYLIKSMNHKKQQFTIFEVFEDDVTDNFVIKARNTFESFCKQLATTYLTIQLEQRRIL